MCTDGDVCSGGSCMPGPALDCSDTDICTTDSCAPADGCHNDVISGCADTDGDGKVDQVDECSTIDWTAPPTVPPDQNPIKLRLIVKKLTGSPAQVGMIFKGLFNPAASAVLPIDPSINGAHLYVEDSLGSIFDVSVPGGLVGTGCGPKDGWKVTGTPAQPVWKYRNVSGALPPACNGGSARGLSSIFFKDVRASKSAIQFKVKGKGVVFSHAFDDPLTRIQASLALGAQPSPGVASPQAIEGECAETLITGAPIPSTAPKPFCKVKRRGATIDGFTCKGD
jgi:hypothetical protein